MPKKAASKTKKPAPKKKATKKKPPKPKPPASQPKRPSPAYFLYLQSRRPDIKKEHPDWKITDVTKEVSKEWRGMDDDQKDPFQKQYKKDKVAYEEKLKEYKLTDDWRNYDKDIKKWKKKCKQQDDESESEEEENNESSGNGSDDEDSDSD